MLKYKYKPGEMLENYLNDVCALLNSLGFHAHKNHPRRNAKGDYLEGEPFDYEFFIDKVYCFDAKENMSGGRFWPIKYSGSRGILINERIKKQALNLCRCAGAGADAFFLVAFNQEKNKLPYNLVKYDADLVFEAIRRDIARLRFEEGVKFNIQELIYGRGFNYGK